MSAKDFLCQRIEMHNKVCFLCWNSVFEPAISFVRTSENLEPEDSVPLFNCLSLSTCHHGFFVSFFVLTCYLGVGNFRITWPLVMQLRVHSTHYSDPDPSSPHPHPHWREKVAVVAGQGPGSKWSITCPTHVAPSPWCILLFSIRLHLTKCNYKVKLLRISRW